MNELTLNTLAIEINCLNEQIEFHKGQAVVNAARCGEKLDLVNKNLGNDKNEFTAWLTKNCHVKVTQAYDYIRLSKDYPEYLNESVRLSGLPSITQAIKLLSATEEVKTEVLEKIESGEKITVAQINQLKKENSGLSLKNAGLENEAADMHRQLIKSEAQLKKRDEDEPLRVKRAAEELNKKILLESKNNQDLFNAANEQNHKLVAFGKTEVDGYKQVIKRLKEEHAEAIAKAMQDGEQSAVKAKAKELAEIERRLEQTTQRLAIVKAESDRISTAINLQTCSDRVTKSVYDSMLSISVKFGEFSLELSEEQRDVASESMIDTWKKIVNQFALGLSEAETIVSDLEKRKVRLLKVV